MTIVLIIMPVEQLFIVTRNVINRITSKKHVIMSLVSVEISKNDYLFSLEVLGTTQNKIESSKYEFRIARKE